MTNTLVWLRDFYWTHRMPVWAGGIGVAVVLWQSVMVLWIVRRLQELAHMRERLSRLADGLALLTDTTEAGLSTIVRELQQIGRRPGSRAASSRSAVARRVAAASRTGVDVATIATSEAMSESEVRLHMKLAEAATESAARGAALRP